MFFTPLLIGCRSTHNASFEPGTLAPLISISDPAGVHHPLQDLRGRVVLVSLWATWCQSCKSQLASLQRVQARYPQESFVVYAPVVNDAKDAFHSFVKNNPLGFLVGISHDDIGSRYKITGVPESFLLDKAGKFVLLNDPETGSATVRVLGPRAWDQGPLATQIEREVSRDT